MSSVGQCALDFGQVDVWLTSLSDIGGKEQLTYQRLLSDSERVRWQRFAVPGAKLQFLVARILLRSILSQYTGVPFESWEFEVNEYGRPRVLHPSEFRDIQFNLSHTEGLVVCAVARECEIGIDVECTRRALDVMSLAQTILSPRELSALTGAPPAYQQRRFFQYWTLKEAFVKARGIGLTLPLDEFWFDLNEAFPRVHFSPNFPCKAERWQFRQYSPTLQHMLAVAVSLAKSDLDIRLQWVVPAARL
ncbi:4'-phosphopantetheinyl transferase [Bradyrhizobium sp. USDA 4524]|uniref:4'-phosphopantetheinyl transferase family protein n=1 Tax=unclassified Bradyrhizobium TaxID=2631580 RepID=UPI0020A12019|nr:MULTISPECIES: 4'-phosphopantetheinyl transferase superfamily protein [unclassified Bradyrhizobium]MCP1846021.1 4'-phosphopantetheinyl transferase [Bradyrhizobium sp. USDA 4538]MCP1907345.1 4'-phosphopantetheinyl transferase [Bradyrhizobium sp. USDA 4537]MCP1985131.1 4'-phosphopantetheinyl transferase [Bradyrhizobium sp. USDA 4539]